jgi:hypothetical protein
MAANDTCRSPIEQAEQMAGDRLLGVVVDRALNGLRHFRLRRGTPVTDLSTREPNIEIEYNNRLLIHALRLLRPAEYGHAWGVPAAFRRR